MILATMLTALCGILAGLFTGILWVIFYIGTAILIVIATLVQLGNFLIEILKGVFRK